MNVEKACIANMWNNRFYSCERYNAEKMGTIIKIMTDTIHHPGPNNSGVWVDKKAGIALGYRRLFMMSLFRIHLKFQHFLFHD